jgi:hypothetical protein
LGGSFGDEHLTNRRAASVGVGGGTLLLWILTLFFKYRREEAYIYIELFSILAFVHEFSPLVIDWDAGTEKKEKRDDLRYQYGKKGGPVYLYRVESRQKEFVHVCRPTTSM